MHANGASGFAFNLRELLRDTGLFLYTLAAGATKLGDDGAKHVDFFFVWAGHDFCSCGCCLGDLM
jgi:hypothetical protein